MLLASLPRMIRLGPALWVCTENFPAVCQWAANTVPAHALCGLSSDRCSIIVLLVQIDLALNDLHHVAATASNQVRVLCHELSLDEFFEFFIVTAHVFSQFPVLQWHVTPKFGADDLALFLLDLNKNGFREALSMYHMKAFGRH